MKRGRLEIERFVDAASTRPAKLLGLYPRKGTIAIGSDADLVIYDPDYQGVISAKTHHVNNDYSGFEGMVIEGRPCSLRYGARFRCATESLSANAAAGVC